MRSVFIQRLHEAMRKDNKIFLLIGDTGFNLVEPLFEEFPDRTLNIGIAEQNLIGVSAGLCNAGFKPVCYAISNFLVHRCFEQTRNDVCLHNYPVILAGTSTGFDNGGLWATHYVVDDIGCMKTLPSMSLYSPSSKESMEAVCFEVFQFKGPAYIRIAKSNFSESGSVKALNHFVLGNKDCNTLVITHGKMLKNVSDAVASSPPFALFVINKIKPLDLAELIPLFSRFEKIVVVEDNFKSGLYNSLCEIIAGEKNSKPPLYFIGPKEEYDKDTGDAQYLENKYGLTPEKISHHIRSLQFRFPST